MQNKYLKFLLIALIVAFVVPQITFASWYNPFSWNWNIMSWFKSPSQTQLVGNDKDSHGCIGSAGYTWCAVKQKCLRTWEEKCELSPTTNNSNSTQIEWYSHDTPTEKTDWNTAAKTCAALGSGWRLPTDQELVTKFLKSKSPAGVQGGDFSVPVGFQDSFYWSGTTASNGGSANYVSPSLGTVAGFDLKTVPNYYVRCVR